MSTDPIVSPVVASQARRTGYCNHPIRLVGRSDAVDSDTGELTVTIDSATEPGGALLVACGNRRATVCPACSETYRGDAWQLINAGLVGGKGLSESVRTHPRLFATLTAPSFGAVHSRRMSGGRSRTCRPRRSGACEHGRPRGCREQHVAGAAVIGQPLCPDCFDYAGAVLWNAHVGALWSRTTIGIRRALARSLGISARTLRNHARLSFIKVIEYQARGIVHLHVVIRADGPSGGGDLPPAALDVETLRDSVLIAAGAASVLMQTPDGEVRAAWGNQIDVSPLASDVAGGGKRTLSAAAYIAKYATKSTDALGALDHRIRSAAEIERLVVVPHLRRMVATCWSLGSRPEYADLRLQAWAHTLGYRGHWTTKSRAYSTTFGALRSARTAHNEPDSAGSERVGHWTFAGRGYGVLDSIRRASTS